MTEKSDDILRVSNTLIDFPVPCWHCGKEYIPADSGWQISILGVSLLQVNNWCSRKCYSESADDRKNRLGEIITKMEDQNERRI